MKKYFIGLLILIAFGILLNGFMNKESKLQIGDQLPVFELLDQDGNIFEVSRYIGKKPMVIYFYPKDDTPGCTKEACKFRDEFEEFTDLGVVVVGISSDDVSSHKRFAEKYRLPFTLLADTKKEVRKLFGVPNGVFGLLPGRVTYIIDKKGVVQYIFESQFGAEKHIDKSLEILKKLSR